ncbi:hypothetical protein LJC09_03765 [Desulfovibrio sp. OttesenSCG-928-F20]|nr:hypothetical protein [Desulfovibrio sp. OttesenSCG-928-F20]
METTRGITWKFQRLGGLDQVTLRSAEEIRGLERLDPKLWAVLSCPATGLEFDQRTLALLDTDRDGRIRVAEVIEAVRWLCERLVDPAAIVSPAGDLPLDLIRDDTDAGLRVAATAWAVLRACGKEEATAISHDDVSAALAQAANNPFNGDGILPPLEAYGQEVCAFIRDVLAVTGGVPDAGGQAGVNREMAEIFMRDLEAYDSWRMSMDTTAGPLGDNTAEAWELIQRLRDKIDDYFLRCDLAAFAPDSATAFNTATDAACLENEGRAGLLDKDSLSALPLSRIGAEQPLDLLSGVNPAWREALDRFALLVTPLLSRPGLMAREEWRAIQDSFLPYAQALDKKPVPERSAMAAPTADFESLGRARVLDLLSGNAAKAFFELVDQDLSVPATAADIAECERLVLYYLNLHRLLMNFVSFYDFYAMRRKATFQAGTLYLDGRACLLCLPVQDKETHSTLASYSQLCLVYCDCRRPAEQGGETQNMSIVAAMTSGEADLLVPGRNGVYVDNTGADWDAVLVKIVSNPISMRESLWQPYKRFGRMVSEQIGKFAGARQAEAEAKAAEKAARVTGALATGGVTAPPQPFDIGRSVGIFAAIGLALGAIGTAIAGLASALFALHWWQYPLLLFGLFLLVSGPSFVMAWLKLRKRNLGPLLEASGWAVNNKLPINLLLGGALTTKAVLPPNAVRSFRDPLRKTAKWPFVLALVLALLLAGGVWLWQNHDVKDFIWIQELMKEAVSIPEPQGKTGNASLPVDSVLPQK